MYGISLVNTHGLSYYVAKRSHLYNPFKSRYDVHSSFLADQFTLNFITHGFDCGSVWPNEGDTSFFLMIAQIHVLLLLVIIIIKIIWLAPRVGKMKRILCSDWLPEEERWVYLARLGLPALFPQKQNSLVQSFGYIINPLLTKFEQSRRLDICLILFLCFMDFKFVLVHKNTKQ